MRSSVKVRRRKHQNRQLDPSLPQGLADSVPAHPGQHQIQNDEIDHGGVFFVNFERRRTIARGRHQVAFGFEIVFNPDGQVGFVFDNEDVVHGWWMSVVGWSGVSDVWWGCSLAYPGTQTPEPGPALRHGQFYFKHGAGAWFAAADLDCAAAAPD